MRRWRRLIRAWCIARSRPMAVRAHTPCAREFDPVTQAESGFMSLNGFPDGEPVRTGPPIVDMATGMSACNAILLALLARDRLGRGQHVEVALIDIAGGDDRLLWHGLSDQRQQSRPFWQFAEWLAHRRGLPGVRRAALYGLRQRPAVSAAGHRGAGTARSRHRSRICPPEKTDRPTRKSCAPSLPGFFSSDKLENWMAKMKKANIPVGYLRTVEEGFNAPEVRDRHRLSQIPHPNRRRRPQHRNAAQYELDADHRSRSRAAPWRAYESSSAQDARLR